MFIVNEEKHINMTMIYFSKIYILDKKYESCILSVHITVLNTCTEITECQSPSQKEHLQKQPRKITWTDMP